MSKYIDPEAMSPEDVEYVRQRPSLLREFKLQEIGDPTVKGYEGHDFDWDTYYDEDGKLRPEPLDGESDEAREAREAREAQEASEKAAREAAEKAEADRIEAERLAAEQEAAQEEELPAEKQWNSDMTKKELDAVIAARNADYDDDEQIVVAKDDKASRIAALEQDDKELAGDEDEESTEE